MPGRKVQVTCFIGKEYVETLDEMATEARLSRSTFVRILLEKAVEAHRSKAPTEE